MTRVLQFYYLGRTNLEDEEELLCVAHMCGQWKLEVLKRLVYDLMIRRLNPGNCVKFYQACPKDMHPYHLPIKCRKYIVDNFDKIIDQNTLWRIDTPTFEEILKDIKVENEETVLRACLDYLCWQVADFNFTADHPLQALNIEGHFKDHIVRENPMGVLHLVKWGLIDLEYLAEHVWGNKKYGEIYHSDIEPMLLELFASHAAGRKRSMIHEEFKQGKRMGRLSIVGTPYFWTPRGDDNVNPVEDAEIME
eukprot:CAMPEP_0184292670 /NCGR_PEP_ID=MMETSP1049-20130417/4396_1 /TAXON_ID=77928 /ORGANISM="Proteomonas sulcata, Strain CCMP704" /LENGTH=249 /DNA_ID=CAMNT_0026600525 /DNA_START=60 /DNA_END=809 /DNA_ORIENTATION=-